MTSDFPRMAVEASVADSSCARPRMMSSRSLSKTRSKMLKSSLVNEASLVSKVTDGRCDFQSGLSLRPELDLNQFRLSLQTLPQLDEPESADIVESSTLSSDLKTLAANFKTSPSLVSREMTEAIKRQEVGNGDTWYWQAKRVNGTHAVKSAVSGILFPSLTHFMSCKDGRNGAENTKEEFGLYALGMPAAAKQRLKSTSEDRNNNVNATLKLVGSCDCVPQMNELLCQRSPTAVNLQESRTYTQARNKIRPCILKHQDRRHRGLSFAFNSYSPLELMTYTHGTQNRDKVKNTGDEDCEEQLRGHGPHQRFKISNGARGQGPDQKDGSEELTCLQLADTILGTKTTDWTRCYQLSQAKVRYIDILERSVSYQDDERVGRPSGGGTSQSVASRAGDVARQASSSSSSSHSLLDQANGEQEEASLTMRQKVSRSKTVRAADGGGNANETRNVSAEDEKQEKRAFIFPSLHSVDKQRSGRAKVTQFTKSTEITHEKDITLDAYGMCDRLPSNVKKPILKSSQQFPVSAQTEKVFSPGHLATAYNAMQHATSNHVTRKDLQVRGASVQSINMEDNWSHSAHANRKCVTTCGTADLKKRAVRFSVSDEVYEFTPSDPVIL